MADDELPAGLGKAELCAALGWSRPTLDARLKRDPQFPVLFARGRVWRFDLAAVCGYLGRPVPDVAPAADAAAEPEPEAPDAPAAPASSTFVDEHLTAGEATARHRRDIAQARLLEDRLRRDRGELVEAAEMRRVLDLMVAHLGQGLDRLPDQVVKLLGLPEDVSDRVRVLVDGVRRTMAEDLSALLSA